jgi:hypothetical protein
MSQVLTWETSSGSWMPASRALARTGRATMVDFLAYSLAGRASSKRRPATSACRMSFVLHMRVSRCCKWACKDAHSRTAKR